MSNKYSYKQTPINKNQISFLNVQKKQSAITLIDLRNMMPPIYDQGFLSSCTPCAVAANYYYIEMKQKNKNIINPSILFLYYNARKLEGSPNIDIGTYIIDNINAMTIYGTCSEEDYPYITSQFATPPPLSCYDIAKKYKILSYKKLSQQLSQLKQCLIDGYAFLFGFTAYTSFESENAIKTGIIPMPKVGDRILGGHTACCAGFNDAKQWFIIRNSWGTGSYDKGYFYLPYQYVINPGYAYDFYYIYSVTKQ